MHEHRLIERMIEVMDAQAKHVEGTGEVDTRIVDRIAEFVRAYADRCHHGKEEDILFRRLEDKRLTAELASGMASLIQDHVYGRSVTRALVEANDRYASGDTDVECPRLWYQPQSQGLRCSDIVADPVMRRPQDASRRTPPA